MDDKSVFRIIYENETNDSFRLSVEFKENYFDFTVFKKSNAWFATVKEDNICLQAKLLEIDRNKYLENLQEYLKNTPPNVSLIFNNKDFIINCTLKNNMKIVYFTHPLEKVNYTDLAENLMEKFYIERNNSLENFITIEKEKMELEKSKTRLQLKLNEFIERKKTDEEELFSNFILILNEKKKRIQHLNELLAAFKRGRSSVNPTVEIKKRPKKVESIHLIKRGEKEVVSDSDSEESYDTDEEKSKKNSDKTSKNDSYALASTSKFDLFADDSPPRHLPKRIKSEESVGYNSCIKPSTSTNFKAEKLNEEKDRKPEGATPNINFSTQDLLDNI